MPNFRTSSLFHYTNYSALKKILCDGFMPFYCEENLSYVGKNYIKESIWRIPMVCFCDIPLMRTNVFTKRYGRYAIGLSKEWALKNGINPILYIANSNITLFLDYLKSIENQMMDRLKEYGSDGKTLIISKDNKDSDKMLQLFQLHGKMHIANLHILGFAKEYQDSDKNDKIHYEENEWRYIIKEDMGEMGIKWEKVEKDESKEEGEGKRKPKPYSKELKKYKLKFEASDITHIVVSKERQKADIIKYIDKLSNIGGCGEAINEEEKRLLYSKIISMEEIGTDF